MTFCHLCHPIHISPEEEKAVVAPVCDTPWMQRPRHSSWSQKVQRHIKFGVACVTLQGCGRRGLDIAIFNNTRIAYVFCKWHVFGSPAH